MQIQIESKWGLHGFPTFYLAKQTGPPPSLQIVTKNIIRNKKETVDKPRNQLWSSKGQLEFFVGGNHQFLPLVQTKLHWALLRIDQCDLTYIPPQVREWAMSMTKRMFTKWLYQRDDYKFPKIRSTNFRIKISCCFVNYTLTFPGVSLY